MEACQTYQLTFTNALEWPSPGGSWNTLKDPNTTNIHTHGLHISGESPADDVLYVKVNPGQKHTCEGHQAVETLRSIGAGTRVGTNICRDRYYCLKCPCQE